MAADRPSRPSGRRYGAVLSLGGGHTGFLHKKHWAGLAGGSEGKPPPRWRPVLLAALASTDKSRATELGAPAAAARPIGTAAPLGFDALVPGLLVNASVSGVFADGLRVTFAGGFDGSLSAAQLGASSSDGWTTALPTGTKLKARLLWLSPQRKTVALSLQPHLTGLEARFKPGAEAGERVTCRVALVAKDGAVLTCRRAPAGEEGETEGEAEVAEGEAEAGWLGWLGPLDVADLSPGQKPADALRKLKPGAAVSAVVTGVDWLSGRLRLSARASVLKRASPPVATPEVGAVVDATIVRLGAAGARLRIGGPVGGSLSGHAPRHQLADGSLQKPEARLAVGSTVRALVLAAGTGARGAPAALAEGQAGGAAGGALLLSLKPSLLDSPLPRIASYAGAAAGASSHGTIEAVRPTALIVAFLNGVKGVVFGSELRATLGAVWDSDPASCYSVGQTVEARVLRSEPAKRRLVLSLLSHEQAAATPALTGVGNGGTAKAGAAAQYPPGAAVALRAGDEVRGVVAGWQDRAAPKEEGGGEEGVWVALSGGGGGHGWLPLSQLGDVRALLPLWRRALRPGASLPPLLVLLVQPKALGGAGRVTLTAKPSLRAALAGGRLPTGPEPPRGVRLLCGWVAKVKREGAYVGFAGPLRGFAASADISDASEDARALLSAGQSVLALVAGGTGGSRERTLQLQLGHDALAEAAKAEAADGVAEAAAVAGLPSRAGAEGAPLLPLAASFLRERWSIAGARAAALEDGDEGDEEEGQKASAAAESVEAALGSARDAAAPLSLEALRAVRVGSVVELRKPATKRASADGVAYAAQLPGGASAPALAPAGSQKLKKEETARGVVLDVDPLSSVVHVSTSDKLVDAHSPGGEGGESSGKKRAAAPVSAAADAAQRLRVGARVVATVALSRPGLLVLSLPKHGHALGVAAHHALWSGAGARPELLAAEAAKYSSGQKVQAVVTSLPSEAADGGAAAPEPLQLSMVDAPLAAAAGDAAVSEGGVGPLRRATDARPGVHALARVADTSTTELHVLLDRRGAVRGRVHFTELAAPGQRASLPSASPEEPVHVVVLGGGKAADRQGARSTGLVECTMRPLDVAGGAIAPRVAAADLSVGQIVQGWVREATGSALWVCLSHKCTGRVAALEASEDPAVVADLPKHFSFGAPVTVRVVAFQPAGGEEGGEGEGEKKRGSRLTLSLVLRPRADEPGEQLLRAEGGGEALAEPVEGSIVSVQVKSVAPGKGADVKLADGVVGRVHITEVVDAWEADPLGRLSEGQTARAVVLRSRTQRGRPLADVSLRASSVAAFGDAPGEHARPLEAAELQEGQLVRGYVKEASARGAFVSLSRSLDGFVPLRQISDEFIDEKGVSAMLPPGTLVVARVVKLASGGANALPSLSLKRSDVEGGTMRKRLTFEALHAGRAVTGFVRKVVDFGVFVRLHGGGEGKGAERLDALCHSSEASDSKLTDLAATFKAGDVVRGVILKTDAEKRRISLSLKPSRLRELAGSDDEEEEEAESEEEAEAADGEEADGSDSGDSAGEESDEEDEDEEDEGEDEDEEEEMDDSEAGVDSDEGGGLDEAEEEEVKPRARGAGKPTSLAEALGGEDPLAGLRAGTDLPGGGGVAGGFDWDDFGGAAGASRRDAEEAEAEEQLGRRGRQAKERASWREREAEMREREAHVASGEAATAEDYERLLVGEPSNSRLWVDYMELQLSLAELERAREVGERALRTIELTAEGERYNLWAAMLNLEKRFGDEESLAALFKRAIAQADPMRIYLHVAATHERAGDAELADATYNGALKRFRRDKRVWLAWLEAIFAQRKDPASAKELLQRAVDSLSTSDHVDVISKFGQLEFRHGSAERGRTVFDGVLSSYPKRIDVWSVYLDMELRRGEPGPIRSLFERAVSLKLSSKKAKYFFKRYLQYASDAGDAALVEKVKAMARAWVERATEA